MAKRFEILFGRRIAHLVLQYCKKELPEIKTIEEFQVYKSSISRENRQQLICKIQLYKHQNYSISDSLWKDFESYMTRGKIKHSSFLGKRSRESYSYESSDYILTDFRMVLKEHLLKKKIIENK